ncbi:FadR/GntR family transcriptional regulator [Hydrogenophaga sp.]|uniref:FadR/GntR family transcriptional regulator n=1 Tax=Hydrogenophaga sp. TaxID=1904254 RepID=UPI003F7246DB
MPNKPATASIPSRAFEDICRGIRAQIASGDLLPGDKLPAERELAEQLGVGRNAVREALRSLENGGVVELRKGRGGGAFILPTNARRITHAMQELHDIGSYTLEELTEARILMVEQMVRLSCERATDDDFSALQKNVDELEQLTKANEMAKRQERVVGFYHLLAAATRNRVLMLLDSSLIDLISVFVERAWQDGNPQLTTLVASRRRVLKHMRARDADKAVAELSRQLLDLHQTLSRVLAGKTEVKPLPRKTRSRA